MMYCIHCGNELNDGAVFCTKCGRAVNANFGNNAGNFCASSPSALSIVGFIFAFIIPFVGLICSIIAHGTAKSNADIRSGNFAKAGIIISSVFIVLAILSVILYYCFILFLFGLAFAPIY